MTDIKAKVFREFGDHGADTLERYFAQIEYTAYWCIRMLRPAEQVLRVIPEGVEDVVVCRHTCTELHQVKTRDESQGPWSTAELIPILCQQYYRRNAFQGQCLFRFVTDQLADTKTALTANSYGPLYRLKFLLEVQRDGQPFSPQEAQALVDLEKVILPRMRQELKDKHNEDLDEAIVRGLLHRTCIETGSYTLRKANNIAELEEALGELFPGLPPYTLPRLKDIYDRLLLLVVRKILIGKDIAGRAILPQQVLDCRILPAAEAADYPNLDNIPGSCVLDKKTRLGGFDPTELPAFHRQRKLADHALRELEILGMQDAIERLTAAVQEIQACHRHEVSRKEKITDKPGPVILERMRGCIMEKVFDYLPPGALIDRQVCLGILWRETDRCSIWWHALDGKHEAAA